MIQAELDSKAFTDKLKIFSSGLGNIYQELLEDVGEKMTAEARALAPRRTGKMANAINFIFDKKNNLGALTTQKNLNKSNIWYARMVESDRNISAKKGEYLVFKINGNWVKVKSVRVKGQPFITPVYNSYFPDGKGFKALQDALIKRMEQDLSK